MLCGYRQMDSGRLRPIRESIFDGLKVPRGGFFLPLLKICWQNINKDTNSCEESVILRKTFFLSSEHEHFTRHHYNKLTENLRKLAASDPLLAKSAAPLRFSELCKRFLLV